jgi:opacity protein-like surface antigen
LVLALVIGAGAFAQDEKPQKAFSISAGIGGFTGGDFGGGVKSTASFMGIDFEQNIKAPYFGGGAYAFIDATYAELTLGIYGGKGKFKYTVESTGADPQTLQDVDISYMNFNIGLLGKYPFMLNKKLSLFPLLGIEYNICLSAKDEDGEEYEGLDGDGKPADFSALWFKLGGGLDFSFTEKVYLRFEALYGLRLANKFENDMKDVMDDFIKSSIPGISTDTKTLLGHGLTAKIAVGFKF